MRDKWKCFSHNLSEFQKQGTTVWKQGSVHILLLIEAELLLFPQVYSIICLSFLIWNNKCLKNTYLFGCYGIGNAVLICSVLTFKSLTAILNIGMLAL
jgi:hypothetical protein